MARLLFWVLLLIVVLSGCVGSSQDWSCDPLVNAQDGSGERLYAYDVAIEDRSVAEVLYVTSLLGHELRRTDIGIEEAVTMSEKNVTTSFSGERHSGRRLVLLNRSSETNVTYNVTTYAEQIQSAKSGELFNQTEVYTRIRFAAIDHDARIVIYPGSGGRLAYRITFPEATAKRFDSLLRDRFPHQTKTRIRPQSFVIARQNPLLVDSRSFVVGAESGSWVYEAIDISFNRSSIERNLTRFDDMTPEHRRTFLGSILPGFGDPGFNPLESKQSLPEFVLYRDHFYHCQAIRDGV